MLPKGKYKVNTSEYLRQTHCQFEVEVKYRDIKPIPDRSQIPGIMVASYDIEADSSHGDFPIAKKDYQKLAQDIITEWTQLITQEEPCPILTAQPRQTIEKWLTLAFDDMYANYNINRIVPIVSSTFSHDHLMTFVPDVKKICDKYAIYYQIEQEEEWRIEGLTKRGLLEEEAQSIKDQEEIIKANEVHKEALIAELHLIFETHLPMIDFDAQPTSHYALLARQVCNEYGLRKCTNTRILQKDPCAWLDYVIQLAFDPIFNSHNINRIYTKGNIKPSVKTLQNMVPKIYEICHDATELVKKKAKTKRDKASGSKVKGEEGPEIKKRKPWICTSLL